MKFLMLIAYTLPQGIVGGMGAGVFFNSNVIGLVTGAVIFGFGLDVLLNGRKDDDDYPCK